MTTLLFSFRRVGLIKPMGHMTYASRLVGKECPNLIMVILSSLMCLFNMSLWASMEGVIAHANGIEIEDIFINGRSKLKKMQLIPALMTSQQIFLLI